MTKIGRGRGRGGGRPVWITSPGATWCSASLDHAALVHGRRVIAVGDRVRSFRTTCSGKAALEALHICLIQNDVDDRSRGRSGDIRHAIIHGEQAAPVRTNKLIGIREYNVMYHSAIFSENIVHMYIVLEYMYYICTL